MGTNEWSESASKSSWDSQNFGDVDMVLKTVHFHKSIRPQWVNTRRYKMAAILQTAYSKTISLMYFDSKFNNVCS